MFRRILALMAFAMIANVSFANPPPPPEEVLLTPQNSVVLRGEVDSKSISELITQMSAMNGQNVYVYISSPGGSIRAGNEFIRFMDAYKGHVTCIADTAASMAFSILQACNTRLVFPDSIIMQHEATFGLEGQTPNNISFLGMILSMLDAMNKMEAARMEMTVEDLKKKIRDDWWLYGTQAVAAKAADGTAHVLCSPELIKSTTTQDVKTFFFSAKLTFSNCPLIGYPVKIESNIKIPANPARFSEELEKFLNGLNQRDKVFSPRSNGFVVP